jgi:hypothetical protein
MLAALKELRRLVIGSAPERFDGKRFESQFCGVEF